MSRIINMAHFVRIPLLLLLTSATNCDYWSRRDALIRSQEAKTLGSSISLTPKEELVNQVLMAIKLKEFDDGFKDPASFLPGMHIFDALGHIDDSEVFQFIKTLPKGGLLHGHDTSLASAEYVFNLTFSENLYACIVDGNLLFHFFREPVSDATCAWEPIELLRNAFSDFDEFVRSQLTLIRSDFREVYSDINIVWKHFEGLFGTVAPLVCYKPIFKQYFYQSLQELHEDNVMYMEFRSLLPTVYDLDGTKYGPLEVAGFYKEALDEFLTDHPDFLGAKLIYSPHRSASRKVMRQHVEIAIALKNAYPDFLAGFDMVGQEDLGYPLAEFIDELQILKERMPLFFHAGETNWFGTSTDLNLVDAVLLGTARIGHGFALLKHPEVIQLVKENGIGVEVCPISNQVLKLVDDMRNHPANYYMSNDLPVVISNDGVTFWGTKGISYDWYLAFMGMASRSADLRFLKQLALNSLQYSAIEDKARALSAWERQWNEFIDGVIRKNVLLHLHAPTVLSRS